MMKSADLCHKSRSDRDPPTCADSVQAGVTGSSPVPPTRVLLGNALEHQRLRRRRSAALAAHVRPGAAEVSEELRLVEAEVRAFLVEVAGLEQ